MDPIRILIVDDNAPFRSGLRALLESVSGMQVVGEAETGKDVQAQAHALQPDVILMDIGMLGMNGIEATRRILQTSPHIRVLMLTAFRDDESVFAAICAGARGYLLKAGTQEEMFRAIRAVGNGEAIFDAAIAERMIHYFSSMQSTPKSGSAQFFPELTAREYEILALIAQRKSNAEISAHLVLNSKTVRNHVSNILSKLQVANRTEAMYAAWRAGLGQRDGEHPLKGT